MAKVSEVCLGDEIVNLREKMALVVGVVKPQDKRLLFTIETRNLKRHSFLMGWDPHGGNLSQCFAWFNFFANAGSNSERAGCMIIEDRPETDICVVRTCVGGISEHQRSLLLDVLAVGNEVAGRCNRLIVDAHVYHQDLRGNNTVRVGLSSSGGHEFVRDLTGYVPVGTFQPQAGVAARL